MRCISSPVSWFLCMVLFLISFRSKKYAESLCSTSQPASAECPTSQPASAGCPTSQPASTECPTHSRPDPGPFKWWCKWRAWHYVIQYFPMEINQLDNEVKNCLLPAAMYSANWDHDPLIHLWDFNIGVFPIVPHHNKKKKITNRSVINLTSLLLAQKMLYETYYAHFGNNLLANWNIVQKGCTQYQFALYVFLNGWMLEGVERALNKCIPFNFCDPQHTHKHLIIF